MVSESLTFPLPVLQVMPKTTLPALAGAVRFRLPLVAMLWLAQLVPVPPVGVQEVVPVELQLRLKVDPTWTLDGATRLTLPLVPWKVMFLLSVTGDPAVLQDRLKVTVCAVEGAVRLTEPEVGRPVAAQPAVPPLVLQEVVPVEVQETVKLALTLTGVGTVRVAVAGEQFTPDWLLTVTLPVVGLIWTAAVVVEGESVNEQLLSIVMVPCAWAAGEKKGAASKTTRASSAFKNAVRDRI